MSDLPDATCVTTMPDREVVQDAAAVPDAESVSASVAGEETALSVGSITPEELTPPSGVPPEHEVRESPEPQEVAMPEDVSTLELDEATVQEALRSQEYQVDDGAAVAAPAEEATGSGGRARDAKSKTSSRAAAASAVKRVAARALRAVVEAPQATPGTTDSLTAAASVHAKKSVTKVGRAEGATTGSHTSNPPLQPPPAAAASAPPALKAKATRRAPLTTSASSDVSTPAASLKAPAVKTKAAKTAAVTAGDAAAAGPQPSDQLKEALSTATYIANPATMVHFASEGKKTTVRISRSHGSKRDRSDDKARKKKEKRPAKGWWGGATRVTRAIFGSVHGLLYLVGSLLQVAVAGVSLLEEVLKAMLVSLTPRGLQPTTCECNCNSNATVHTNQTIRVERESAPPAPPADPVQKMMKDPIGALASIAQTTIPSLLLGGGVAPSMIAGLSAPFLKDPALLQRVLQIPFMANEALPPGNQPIMITPP